MTPLEQIAIAAIPSIIPLIADILNLRHKYPDMTPDQLASVIKAVTSNSDTTFLATLAKLAADDAAHPQV